MHVQRSHTGSFKIEHGIAPAVYKALMENRTLTVGQLMRDNADREAALPAIVLMIVREGQCRLLPDDDFLVKAGDALLLVGRHDARSVFDLTLQNANALNYILTGQDRQAGRQVGCGSFCFRNALRAPTRIDALAAYL